MAEQPNDILGPIIFFSSVITAFALAAFSPLKQLRQPVKLFVIGFINGAIAALISGLGMLGGMITSRSSLFVVVISIVIGALFSLLASSETISEKKRDELVRKSDDQSWRV
jgi:predicted neutral ceramidase superfamily lipid hydrolase